MLKDNVQNAEPNSNEESFQLEVYRKLLEAKTEYESGAPTASSSVFLQVMREKLPIKDAH